LKDKEFRLNRPYDWEHREIKENEHNESNWWNAKTPVAKELKKKSRQWNLASNTESPLAIKPAQNYLKQYIQEVK
jgi:hypothetical protein